MLPTTTQRLHAFRRAAAVRCNGACAEHAGMWVELMCGHRCAAERACWQSSRDAGRAARIPRCPPRGDCAAQPRARRAHAPAPHHARRQQRAVKRQRRGPARRFRGAGSRRQRLASATSCKRTRCGGCAGQWTLPSPRAHATRQSAGARALGAQLGRGAAAIGAQGARSARHRAALAGTGADPACTASKRLC